MKGESQTGLRAPFVIAVIAIGLVVIGLVHSFSSQKNAPAPAAPVAATSPSLAAPGNAKPMAVAPAVAPVPDRAAPVVVPAPRQGLALFFREDIAATNAELALELAMQQMATNNPAGLVDWVKNILQQGGQFEGIDPAHITTAAVQALIQSSNAVVARDAIAQWMRIPNGPEVGNTALESAARDLATTSPTDALDWLKSLPMGNDRNYAMTTLASDWVKTDPKAAMDWTTQLSDADGRTSAMERAFNDWAQADDTSARQWIKNHLDDPAAETMVTSMVAESGLSYSNPQEAIVWADMISDPSARLENVEDIFLSWVRREPDAAANYIKNDPTLTADEKKQVLQSFFGWKNAGGAN